MDLFLAAAAAADDDNAEEEERLEEEAEEESVVGVFAAIGDDEVDVELEDDVGVDDDLDSPFCFCWWL